ncbi:hypothetical protein H9P43_000622 [Blastocladiella emersonii ATCC 22665]|nr:hypothetical protein H9P43_000622 [Blastocladiella emersonii ATCC 22665]
MNANGVQVGQPAGSPQRQVSYSTKISDPTGYGIYGAMMTAIGDVVGFLGSFPCICCLPNQFKTVEQGKVGIIKRFGQATVMVDPGLYKINVMSESLLAVDIKLQVVDMPRQVIMTRDNVSINIDSVLYYVIADPYVATFMIANLRLAITELAQTALRQMIGMRTLQECIELRDSIAHDIEKSIRGPAHSWGVRIQTVLLKDVLISPDLVESLSAAAKQRRLGESKIIAAEAEVAAAKLMKAASEALNSQSAMQIRYLDTLKHLASTPHTKIVFVPDEPEEGGDQSAKKRSGAGGVQEMRKAIEVQEAFVDASS